jgi:hypothetical protein
MKIVRINYCIRKVVIAVKYVVLTILNEEVAGPYDTLGEAQEAYPSANWLGEVFNW